jgi:sporulation protein YqfC
LERRKREKTVLSAAAELFELPPDAVAGLPHVEVLGRSQLYMENHRGILSYSEEEIAINGDSLVVKVMGKKLTLVSMTGEGLRIRGEIDRVEWVR